IRVSRLVYASLLVLGVLVAAIALQNFLALHMAFWLAASPVFLGAWQGAKNDYPSALAGAIFMIFVIQAFISQRGEKWRDRFFLTAVWIGTLCLLIRPWIVPPLAVFFFLYPFWEYRYHGRKPWAVVAIS